MTRFHGKLVKRQPGNHGPRPRHRRPCAPRRRFLPRVDLMEDRTVLSPLWVTSSADSGPAPQPTSTTLETAIDAARRRRTSSGAAPRANSPKPTAWMYAKSCP